MGVNFETICDLKKEKDECSVMQIILPRLKSLVNDNENSGGRSHLNMCKVFQVERPISPEVGDIMSLSGICPQAYAGIPDSRDSVR